MMRNRKRIIFLVRSHTKWTNLGRLIIRHLVRGGSKKAAKPGSPLSV